MTRLIALTAVLLAALTLTACGGSSSSSNENATQLVSDTFSSKQPIHSGQIALSVNLDLHGSSRFPVPVSVKLSGPFQSNGGGKLPDFALNLLFGSGGQSFGAGLTATSGKAYIEFLGQSYVLPDQTYQSLEQSWAQRSHSSAGSGTFAAFGVHPILWLDNPVRVGAAQVGGTQAVHVTSSVNVPRFLADVNTLLGKTGKLGVSNATGTPTSISPKTQQALAQSVTSSRVDIFSGSGDHTLRRLTVTVNLRVPLAQQAQLGGLTDGTIGIDLLISQLNQPQQISAPANAQSMSQLMSAVGAAGGGANSGATTATTPSGGTVTAPQPYLDCLKKAGNDLQKIQGCASLLNGG